MIQRIMAQPIQIKLSYEANCLAAALSKKS